MSNWDQLSQHAGLSRRSVLKGLGVSMALPWLESLRGGSAFASVAADAPAAPPVRMAFIFVPNGVHMPDWRPPTEGYGFRMPYILEPLSKVRDDLIVFSGLTHNRGRANDDGAGDHARSASVFLTGAQPRKTSGANIRSGVSVDQYAAQRIGRATKFPSLELGCERGRSAGNCDSGYSCAYSSNISWSSSATPVAKETNPRLVFERLFASGNHAANSEGRGRRELLRKSILDFVSEDAQRLMPRLGRNDQRKVDEYMGAIREIERRIEMAKTEGQAERADMGNVKYEGPDDTPEDYQEHLRLMCDMMVLAFQSDLTRISSFMFADAGSNRSYRQINIPDGHHDLSHHGGDAKKHAKIRDINRFHVQQLAYLAERLKSIPEGDGTLLDNCMIVYGSGLGDGNRHNHDDLPVLLLGRGGGTIDTGRHVQVAPETPMNNLFISMLDRVGIRAPFLGDSTGPLKELGT